MLHLNKIILSMKAVVQVGLKYFAPFYLLDLTCGRTIDLHSRVVYSTLVTSQPDVYTSDVYTVNCSQKMTDILSLRFLTLLNVWLHNRFA